MFIMHCKISIGFQKVHCTIWENIFPKLKVRVTGCFFYKVYLKCVKSQMLFASGPTHYQKQNVSLILIYHNKFPISFRSIAGNCWILWARIFAELSEKASARCTWRRKFYDYTGWGDKSTIRLWCVQRNEISWRKEGLLETNNKLSVSNIFLGMIILFKNISLHFRNSTLMLI